MNKLNAGICMTKLRRSYMLKKNSITCFTNKVNFLFGIKNTTTNKWDYYFFFTTTNVCDANFHFVHGCCHFIDTQTFLTCCCAILLKIKKIANGIVSQCLLDLMQCTPIPVGKKKNQKPKTEFVNA